MEVSKLANKLLLKIAFFEVSTIVSVCMKLQYLDIRGSILKTEHTPGFVLTSRVQFLNLNYCFDQRVKKNDILDHFGPRSKF